ncbi:MAG: ammonium transporter, partial [Planctomycetota bacterium]|nr:ammonium transporter [Planctomycetota bacterium]
DAMEISYSIDSLFLFVSAILVIFMQAGFSMVEVGLNSAKNAVNILFKNAIDFCIGVTLFYFIGYALMYPGEDFAGKYFGYNQPDFSAELSAADIKSGFEKGAVRKLHPQADFLFQAAFCATAATIVSGAVAGRLKFPAYLIYTVALTGFVYPVAGFWKWGGGWLGDMGFHDFAGSIVVHACGGFAGLAGAMVLGPRIGRYSKEGRSIPILGSNMTLATLGVFILLIGWYGFNPGSQLAFSGSGNMGAVSTIAMNTTLAACAGGIVGMALSWVVFKKPDLTMCLNGILGGLVGITANCDCVTNNEALVIGAVAGVFVLGAIIVLDKLKIDDPVGAFPVHGVCGIWGGIATGIFGEGKVLSTQIIGSVSIAVFAFTTMFILFQILKAVNLLRVSREEEIQGLDIHEHGMPAYAADAAY